MALILGMGNPLLDMSAVVKPEMLEKYSLKANDAILYDKEDLYDDMAGNYPVEYIAGGATQNSCRVAAWLLAGEQPRSVAFFGCVGADASAATLERVAGESGMVAAYQRNADHPTGKCAVLVTGQERSLATKLDAANHFTAGHLDEPANWAVVESAAVFYSSGFFLTVSPESMLRVGRHAAADERKHFAINLSAPFLCEFFKEPMLEVMAYADVVFGNEAEADAFAANNGIEGSRTDVARAIAARPCAGGKRRVVVVTQGAGPVIVVDGAGGAATEHAVAELAADKIVDTNGAGDAFVGGFLAQLALGKPVGECVRCGIWAAAEIIQQPGCTCPPGKAYASAAAAAGQ